MVLLTTHPFYYVLTYILSDKTLLKPARGPSQTTESSKRSAGVVGSNKVKMDWLTGHDIHIQLRLEEPT